MATPDLSKMSIRDLCVAVAGSLAWGHDDKQFLAEITRRMRPPHGHIRDVGGNDHFVTRAYLTLTDIPSDGDHSRVLCIITDDAMDARVPIPFVSPTPPSGCVRTPDGRDVRVLGTLPMTADGCVVGDGARLFSDVGDVRTHICTSAWASPPFPANDGWYSTREAAEAARSGQ